MSAFLVVDVTVHDADRYMEYARQVHPFVQKHGGRYHVRGGETQVLEGDWHPQRLVVVEFPSRENALAFVNDPGYTEVAAIRHASATTNMVLADGVEP